MVLQRPQFRLTPRALENLAQIALFAIAQDGDILIKRAGPAKRDERQQGDQQKEQPGRLQDGLDERYPHPARKGHSWRRLSAKTRQQVLRENRLPGFHPEKEQCQPQGSSGQTLLGEGAAAHIRPEEKRTEHERRSAKKIAGQNGRGRQTQQVEGLLD